MEKTSAVLVYKS